MSKAEEKPVSEYGEPWRNDFTFEDGWIRGVGNYRLLERGLHGNESHAERAVACVNALAGIPNPEAVRELIEAVREWTDVEKCVTDERIFKALASLSAPSTGAQQK